MVVAAARPHTDAVVVLLEAADLLVGRGEAPDEGGWQGEEGASVFVPYVVLYPSPGSTDGPVTDPSEYLIYTVQGNCVAASQEGAEAVADLMKTALVDVPLTVQGRASYPGLLVLDRPASRDDTVAPPVHYAVLQVSWRTQPA